jgi:hypothetical protein
VEHKNKVMARKVYILESGSKHLAEGGIFWYDKVAFKSKADMLFYVQQGFEINKGWDKKEVVDIFDTTENTTYITYKALSIDDREFLVRLKLTTLKLQYT